MDPETKWIATAPGILELPTTKFRIEYVAGSYVPFRAFWDGVPIPHSACTTLRHAQKACSEHMAELITMGFEV